MNSTQPANINNPLSSNKQYIIALALEILCFIIWFIPVASVNAIIISKDITLTDYYEIVDLAFLPVIYIISAIAGIICLALPVVLNGKFTGRWIIEVAQAAPLIQLLLLIFCYINIAETASFTFGGVITIIVTLANIVWTSKILNKIKKANKEAKAQQ